MVGSKDHTVVMKGLKKIHIYELITSVAKLKKTARKKKTLGHHSYLIILTCSLTIAVPLLCCQQ